MHYLILTLLIALYAGCTTGGGGPGDGAATTCVTAGCPSGQVCVQPCQLNPCSADGAIACPAPFCATLPAQCAASPTCACLADVSRTTGTSADPCNNNRSFASLGVCSEITMGVLRCGGCD